MLIALLYVAGLAFNDIVFKHPVASIYHLLHTIYIRPATKENKDLREIGWDGGHWIDLAQDRDQWRALVKAVMNFRAP
jgi:hypothetical protein